MKYVHERKLTRAPKFSKGDLFNLFVFKEYEDIVFGFDNGSSFIADLLLLLLVSNVRFGVDWFGGLGTS